MIRLFAFIICFNCLIPLFLTGQQNKTAQEIPQLFLTQQWRDSSDRILYRTETYKGRDMAIIVMDIWDKHWCSSITQKLEALIPGLNKTLEAARELGIQVIFAPSEVVSFYDSYPQRQKIKNLTKIPLLEVNKIAPVPLPWGKTGGCECGPGIPCREDKTWTRQHPSLNIEENDLISGSAEEINAFCKINGIKTLLFSGIASNMCVTWTRSFSVISMMKYGYETLVIRDLVEAITGNGYDPDRKIKDSTFTPKKGSDSTLVHIEKYICPTITANQLLLATGKEMLTRPKPVEKRMFSREYVRNYKPKGPTKSFRQLCYDYNWVGREMVNLPLKFTEADPVAYAALSKKANLDAALVLAVPHHGYTTHSSEFGEMFPGLKRDWFGEVVQELHKQNISALGYITLGANWKFMRDHLGLRQIQTGMDKEGQLGGWGLCLNAPGYLTLVSNYSRELLTYYPIDGIRYDFMVTPYGCDCDGCRSFYKTVYKEDFTSWDEIKRSADSSRYLTFNIETLRRAAQTLHDVCKSVKPGVEVWQNHISPMLEADLNTGRLFDIAYVEFGSPFRMLALRGILDKNEIIVGQTLKSPIRNLVMALGARCYQYINVDQKTALPVGDELKWVEEDLSSFFAMVADKQSFLENTTPLSDVGILFSENTRYRFKGFDRVPYMMVCESITNAFLEKSIPPKFINVLDLEKGIPAGLRMLLLPLTTGLTVKELEHIKTYVENGGNLVIMGDALMYNEKGQQLPDFALAKEMGVRFSNSRLHDTIQIVGAGIAETVTDLTTIIPQKGKTVLWTSVDGKKIPLVHENRYGRGNLLYIASATAVQTLAKATGGRFGKPFIEVAEQKQVVLAEQPDKNRWILHLIDPGDYQIRIKKNNAGFTTIRSTYPASAQWNATLQDEGDHWKLTVSGDADARMLVLQ